MPVKANWENGEQFNASDANAVGEAVNAAYVKPAGGVPITDMTSGVQVSLGKADTAVQSVTSTSITDSTTTGRAVVTATDAAAARTTLGVAYGTTAGTVAQGNDSRLTPSSTSITDSTATGRALITTTDASSARTTLGVAYGTAAGTVAQGNDSRITGAQQTSAKGVANGYASLDGGGKVPIAQLPSSIMEYQGTYNASTNSPNLVNGTGSTGDVYRVSVAGTRNFGAGNIVFAVGDYAIYNGTVWEKSDTTDAVSSVAGLTGDVTASSLRGAIATGTPSASTWLRGDGAWATLPASGITRSVQTITTPTTLGSAANTDYVYFLSNTPAVNPNFEFYHTVIDTDGAADSTTLTNLTTNNPVNLQLYGTARMSTAQKKFGNSSLLFDGSGWARTASSIDFTGSWTIEGWFYPTAGGFSTLWEIGDTTRPMFPAFSMYSTLSTSPSYSLNAWYHLATVKNAATGTLKIFVDGVERASMTDTVNWGVAKLVVGKRTASSDALSQNYYGYIDGLRVAKTAIYTSNFTAPTQPFSAPPVFVAETKGTPTLPTAVSNTNQYTLKNISGSALTMATTSSQTVDGSSGAAGISNGAAVRLISDGQGWRTV